MLNGTIDLARRIAVKLNAGGKVAMFSNPATFANPTKAPIWLDEQRLVDGLKGCVLVRVTLNTEPFIFILKKKIVVMRGVCSSSPRPFLTFLTWDEVHSYIGFLWGCRQLSILFWLTCVSPNDGILITCTVRCAVYFVFSVAHRTSYQFNYEFFRAEQAATDFQLPNLLKESNLGVPIGMHTYLNNMTEDPTPHLAAFMIFRQQHWYSFSSTGWLDNDWEWQPIYDKLSECGNPVDVKPVGAPAPLVYTRKYQHCAFKLDCSNPKPKSCVTSIKWSATGEVSNYPAVGATQGLAPAHGRAYYEQLHQQELHSSN